MPHDRPFTTLFHPDQALTAEQAAERVRDLIYSYSQSVSALFHDTLSEEDLLGYTETMRSLLERAGALEPHLCGMYFFLPDQLARSVVAIIVAAYYQSALLDASEAQVIVDVETLEDMTLYLRGVSTYVDSLCSWLASEKYTVLQGVAKKAVSEMRNRVASTAGSPSRHDVPFYVARCPTPRARSKTPEVPFARLELFFGSLSTDPFSEGASSPTISGTVELPFGSPGTVVNASPVAGPSSPTTATPSPFHTSFPELVLYPQEFQADRRSSLTSSDTTCVEEPTLGSPPCLEAKIFPSPDQSAWPIPSEPTPDARDPQPLRTSLKRRRRTTSTFASSSSSSLPDPDSGLSSSSLHPRKRHKQVNLRAFACVQDVEVNYRPYVGCAVPIRLGANGCNASPMTLPSRNVSISPTSSQTSAALRARSLSPLELRLGLELGQGLGSIPPPSPSGNGVSSVWVAPGPSTLLAPDWRYGMDGIEIDGGSDREESDGESFTTADEGLYADAKMEDGSERDASASSSQEEEACADTVEEDEDNARPDTHSRPSSPPSVPVLSSKAKAKGKRRWFANTLRTFVRIFDGR
ncbi:hypothetical protein GSI_02998 [Ganoderma sinense ZZ0214-1]|uniref:Uncharacterized protein n=1 Tax=Ganoderma sinense ZZ0214-1 TaxID=1077348 RepID=A0A2G8SNQ7_9APHY|nr:hypothetical protein GSI_02998 [Ganoderma sinense ZZ0214-1]